MNLASKEGQAKATGQELERVRGDFGREMFLAVGQFSLPCKDLHKRAQIDLDVVRSTVRVR